MKIAFGRIVRSTGLLCQILGVGVVTAGMVMTSSGQLIVLKDAVAMGCDADCTVKGAGCPPNACTCHYGSGVYSCNSGAAETPEFPSTVDVPPSEGNPRVRN